ncbi:MAG: hypothetical protein EP309_04115 [Gammaproteobacteria bacterium]|jgi:hypothetical protein|nr:hypothetical protein [Candidatus Thioaporhodococcus sediminis]TNF55346.1 MAG: hypothetical protein EP309_04115 [Gammaproteobacteria bacterium]
MAHVFQLHLPNTGWVLFGESEEPGVGIRLGQHGYAIDGSILIGPILHSEADVDATVDRLITELESVRAQAKRELQRLG